jgi:hypothetical protein
MTRPRVQLETPNQSDRLRVHLDRTLPALRALPGVVGITLNGGLSRGYADDHSEIDVTLFLTPADYARWQAGAGDLAVGIVMLDGMLYDLSIEDIAAAQARDWAPVALWDLSYAEILHDPQGVLCQLKADKLIPPDPLTAGGPLFEAWWHFRLAADAWRERGDPLQAHLMLNAAIMPLVRALFLANGEYVPHDKWLIHLSRTLAWTPDNWDVRLALALTAAPAIANVGSRQKVIAGLWQDIDTHIVLTYDDPDYPLNMMHHTAYDQLAALVHAGRMTTAAWAETFGDLTALSREPLHSVTTVSDGLIRLNRERFLNLEPSEMYTWHYAVLNALRGDTI